MHRPSPKSLLSLAGVPALLIANLVNIRYLTGLEATSALLLVQKRRFVLFVDARYQDMAKRRTRGIVIHHIDAVAQMMKEVPVCGYESDEVTVQRYLQWKKKFPSTKFVRSTGAVEEFRRQKSEEELRLIRRAHRMTKELLRRVPSALRAHTTEVQLARQLLIWALEMGADGLSFDPIVAFGTHTSSPHHRPTNRVLQKGHVVQIDVGVRYRGYCADMSEVFFTAQPTALQKRIYDALRKAKNAAMRAVRPGMTNRQLDQIARAVLREQGIEHAFTHALGHGVGLEVHEGPTLSSKAPVMKLFKGEVLAIEPGAYFAGKFGMRLEDMIVVE